MGWAGRVLQGQQQARPTLAPSVQPVPVTQRWQCAAPLIFQPCKAGSSGAHPRR